MVDGRWRWDGLQARGSRQRALGYRPHRPLHISWKELIVIGCTASIGLTVELFVAATVLSLVPLRLEMERCSAPRIISFTDEARVVFNSDHSPTRRFDIVTLR